MDLVIDGVRWVLWILVKGSMFLIDSVYNIIRPILSFDIGSNNGVAMVGHPDDVPPDVHPAQSLHDVIESDYR
ncbi:MAG: hypothetical protein ACLRTA_05125 [Clostridia bacterium]